MIRILHVIHGMDCGGTENMIMNIYRNIDRDNYQFDFLVHTDKDCFFDNEILRLGGRIYHAPYYHLTNLAQYSRYIRKLFSNHKEWGIVHGHLGSCACIYLRIARKLGMYTIAHSHAIKFKDVSVKEYMYRIHAFLTRGVPDVYFGCSYDAGVARYGEKIAQSKDFYVVNNAIDSSRFIFSQETRDKIRGELNISNNFVIGHVGRFIPAKSHWFLIDVFEEYIKIDSSAVLLLVGDGELKYEIIEKINKKNLSDRVIMTGTKSNIPDYLMAMDCFVFPSRNEGLGISLVEAQAAGLKCYANSDGIPSAAKVTDLLEFIPVKEGAQLWANKIYNGARCYKRKNMMSEIIAANYDIKNTTEWLSTWYLNNNKIR